MPCKRQCISWKPALQGCLCRTSLTVKGLSGASVPRCGERRPVPAIQQEDLGKVGAMLSPSGRHLSLRMQFGDACETCMALRTSERRNFSMRI